MATCGQEFESLTPDQQNFLTELQKVYEQYPAVAREFEVVHDVSRRFAKVEDGQAMVIFERCKSSVFSLLVLPEDEAQVHAEAQAAAAGSADPCRWWRWNGSQYVCVAYSSF